MQKALLGALAGVVGLALLREGDLPVGVQPTAVAAAELDEHRLVSPLLEVFA